MIACRLFVFVALVRFVGSSRVVSTPFGRYEMRDCRACALNDVRLPSAHACAVPFASWWPGDATQSPAPESIEHLVVAVAGGGQRAENVHDFVHRLFEADAWSGARIVVLAPMLPLLCESDDLSPAATTLADSAFAAAMLPEFCTVMALRFGTSGCHFVGLSNGGIASLQMVLRRAAPVDALSLTLFASAVLDERDVAAVARPGNPLCSVPLTTFVGTRDVPFFEAARDMHAALASACGASQHSRTLVELAQVHHWNIVEAASEQFRGTPWTETPN